MRLTAQCGWLAVALGLLGCDASEGAPDAAADASPAPDGQASVDTDPPMPAGTDPSVQPGDGATTIVFTQPAAPDYAGALIVRTSGDVRPTELPPRGAPLALGDRVGTGEVVAILAPGTTSWADAEAEGDHCWSVFGFDASYNYADLGGGCRAGVDLTPPAALTDLAIEAGGEWLELRWSDPAEGEAVHVRIVAAEGADPAGPDDGLEVCDPCASPLTRLELEAGVAVHHAAYVVDAAGNVSAAARATGAPGAVARTFEPVGLPVETLRVAHVSPDGTEWAAGDAGLVARRAPGGVWAEHARLSAQPILALWGAASDDVWAGGGGGELYHWDGSAWTAAASPTSFTINAFWGNSASDIWAAVRSSVILRYDGAAWTVFADRDDIGATQHLQGIYAPSASDVHVVGGAGDVYRWNGASWSVVDMGSAVLHGIWGSAPDAIRAVGVGAGCRFDGTSWTTDPAIGTGIAIDGAGASDVRTLWFASVRRWDGATWTTALTPPSPNDLTDLAHGGPDGAWIAVGEAGTVIREVGGEWRREVGGSTAAYHAIHGAPDDSRMFAVGASLTIAERTAGGLALIAAGGTSNLWDVHVMSAGEAVAVGSSRTWRRFDGTSWTSETAGAFPDGSSLVAVWGESLDDHWAAGGGSIGHYAGGDWTVTPVGVVVRALHGFGADDVIAVGESAGVGTVLRWDGAAWSTVLSDACGPLAAVHGAAPDDVWAVGEGGCVEHWDGTSWTEVDASTTADLHGVWAADRYNVFFVGDEAAVRRWNGAGVEVLALDGTASVSGVWGAGPSSLWLVGPTGWARRGAPRS